MDAEQVSEAQATVAKPKPKKRNKPKRQPRYNVILWDDDHHTYAYVIEMLMELFGKTPEEGFLLAQEVDTTGRVILLTTTKEHAELKQEQVHAYGRDIRMADGVGSMFCTIEPMPGD